ncbi:MAG: ECF transporter S component [Oscillospiraceae bacterium]|jgi:uncharacterized membrane protein|nr:ECF transporter S component [Oscillospiraceae bacterium]
MTGKLTVRSMAIGGALGALIFAATCFLRIPIGWAHGYVNLGDGVIFAAANLLGPIASLCAAIGSCLADVASGYSIYALPTFLIKGSMGYIAGRVFRSSAKLFSRAAAMVVCELIMVAGYAMFETAVYGWAAAAAAIPMNLLQGAAGVVFGTALLKVAIPGVSMLE